MIGIFEVLGAIGLILPAVTSILPWLTPVAAVGLSMIMLGAMFTHARRKEFPQIGVNIVLFFLALFIVYGRFIATPF